MYRPYVTDPPLRKDVTFYTNSDYPLGVVWATTGGTPVPVASAELTLEFDLPATTFDPDTGEPEPDPDPVREVLDPRFRAGRFRAGPGDVRRPQRTVGHGRRTLRELRRRRPVGRRDPQQPLRRGIFTVEQGVTT